MSDKGSWQLVKASNVCNNSVLEDSRGILCPSQPRMNPIRASSKTSLRPSS